jgi:hypothetical protein
MLQGYLLGKGPKLIIINHAIIYGWKMKFDKNIPSQMYRYWVTQDAKTGPPPPHLQKQADMKLSSWMLHPAYTI